MIKSPKSNGSRELYLNHLERFLVFVKIHPPLPPISSYVKIISCDGNHLGFLINTKKTNILYRAIQRTFHCLKWYSGFTEESFENILPIEAYAKTLS